MGTPKLMNANVKEEWILPTQLVSRCSDKGNPAEVRGGHAARNVAAAWQASVR